jgi:folate-binding protein YgfZ
MNERRPAQHKKKSDRNEAKNRPGAIENAVCVKKTNPSEANRTRRRTHPGAFSRLGDYGANVVDGIPADRRKDGVLGQAWREFVDALIASSRAVVMAREGECAVVGCYGDLAAEYAALGAGPAVVDRSYRGLLEVTGKDRAGWLHNLTTNEIRNLGPGEGSYAFATNVQGRILFDLNVMALADRLWVDLDRRFLGVATAHFEKYRIVEDVAVADRSDEFVRIGLAGDVAVDLVAALGVRNARAMPSVGTAVATWQGVELRLMRDDFCGTFGVALFVPADRAVALWRAATGGELGKAAVPAGDDAVQVRRVESGIPWPGCEITDAVLPAETGQLERAVSFHKGCYLGQEVVERMRSRGSLARRLCGLRLGPGGGARPGDEVRDAADKPVGRVTSVCTSLVLQEMIGLGYVKSSSAAAGQDVVVVSGDGKRSAAHVVDLPFSRSKR